MVGSKRTVIVICIIALLLTLNVGRIEEKDEVNAEEKIEESSITFYDLIMDIDRLIYPNIPAFVFASYEPGDNVTVKDTISKMDIQENVSTVHNGKDYECSVNIWLDSIKELAEYYEKPTLSLVSDHNRTTMESNFRVGDEITIHFTIGRYKQESIKYDSRSGDIVISGCDNLGMKVLNVAGSLNDERARVEQIDIKIGLLAGSSDLHIQDVIIELSWNNHKNFLVHYNNTAFYHETLEFKEIVVHPGVFIYETLFDNMEKPDPPTVDLFSYEILRDMEDCSLPNGILTPGDVIKIIFNFSQFQEPPTGGGLDPGSYVEIKIIPKHGIPRLEAFTIPDVFPEEGEWINL